MNILIYHKDGDWEINLIFNPRLILNKAKLYQINKQKNPCANRGLMILFGGERGIRTLDTRLTYTPLAGARLQPLGHFSMSLTMLASSTQICRMAVSVSGRMISHCAKNQRLVSFFSPEFKPSDSF